MKFFLLLVNRIRFNFYFSNSILPFATLLYVINKGLLRTVSRKIKVNGQPVKYWGYQIQFPKDVGQGILTSIYWNKEVGFEKWTGRTLISAFKQAEAFIDIGANFGFYTALASLANSKIEIHAIEPLTENFGLLSKFVTHNKCRASLYQFACSNVDGKEAIYYPKSKSHQEKSTASLNKNFFYNKRYKEMGKETIQCTTLDKHFENNFHQKISKLVIKVDVEGHELQVLQGAQDLLRLHKPLVVCEVSDTSEGWWILLEKIDYCMYGLSSAGLIKMQKIDWGQYGFRDFLLVPQKSILARRNLLSYDELDGLNMFSESKA